MPHIVINLIIFVIFFALAALFLYIHVVVQKRRKMKMLQKIRVGFINSGMFSVAARYFWLTIAICFLMIAFGSIVEYFIMN